MRPDMFKVIVERPRKYKAGDRAAAARRRDWEGPAFLGMRAGYYCRCLNENLAPLRRYLQKQRGRPWSKVLSELRAAIDARSTVKRHILEHLEDFVAANTWMQDGQVWYSTPGGPPELLRGRSRYRRYPVVYVDPRTGILRETAVCPEPEAPYMVRYRAEQAVLNARRRIVSETEQLLAIEGIWYRVEVAVLPQLSSRNARGSELEDRRWDAVRTAWVTRRNDDEFEGKRELGNSSLFGSPELYAVSKRQLGKRELRAAGLNG